MRLSPSLSFPRMRNKQPAAPPIYIYVVTIMAEKTIFQKIIDKEIPAKIIHEDYRCLAFHDVAPQAPVHVLVIPKKPITSLAALDESDADLIGHMSLVIRNLAKQLE